MKKNTMFGSSNIPGCWTKVTLMPRRTFQHSGVLDAEVLSDVHSEINHIACILISTGCPQICLRKMKFQATIFRSRPHCRRCGLSVCSKCVIEMDRNGTGLQILSTTGVRTEPVHVENREVLSWHDELRKQAMHLKEKINKVRVCHKCLYGSEYNRKDEIGYLRWIKVGLPASCPIFEYCLLTGMKGRWPVLSLNEIYDCT